MSFAFPAYHEEIIYVAEEIPVSIEIAKKTLFNLNAIVEIENESKIISNIGMNLRTWGEKIVLNFEKGKIKIRSQCSFPLQCLDWGKNTSNVVLFKQGYEINRKHN
jgi:hypothetical protein